MRSLLTILCSTSLIYGAPFEETNPEIEQLALDQKFPDEIAALDPGSVLQAPLTLDITPIEPIEIPTPHFELPRKSPFWAVTLSGMVPGLGHVYLGDMRTAGGLFTGTGAGVGLFATPQLNGSVRFSSLIAAQSAWIYGIYAAYRDARVFNHQEGYHYAMPTDSLADLTAAPFRWSIIKKPEVWGGTLGLLAMGVGVGYLSLISNQTASAGHLSLAPIAALPIGIGEEALYRGGIQSALAEYLPPWGAITLSSLIFSAAHIPNALLLPADRRTGYYTFSLPLITVVGAYCGWLTHKNHSLQESVALHTWYDFILMASAAWATRAAIAEPQEFSVAFPF